MGANRRLAPHGEFVGPIRATEHRHQCGQPTQDLGLEERVVDCLLEQPLASFGRLGYGRGPEYECDDEPLDDLPLLESILGMASVCERAVGRLRAQRKASAEVVSLCDESPGSREA